MPNPTLEKKIAAAQAMHAEIINPETHLIDDPKWNAETIAARIRELAGAIRSPKWRDACEAYARFMEANPDRFDWAYLQGSVYFSHATLN